MSARTKVRRSKRLRNNKSNSGMLVSEDELDCKDEIQIKYESQSENAIPNKDTKVKAFSSKPVMIDNEQKQESLSVSPNPEIQEIESAVISDLPSTKPKILSSAKNYSMFQTNDDSSSSSNTYDFNNTDSDSSSSDESSDDSFRMDGMTKEDQEILRAHVEGIKISNCMTDDDSVCSYIYEDESDDDTPKKRRPRKKRVRTSTRARAKASTKSKRKPRPKRKQKPRKRKPAQKRVRNGGKRCARLLLNDALKDVTTFSGWSSARVKAWKQKDRKPNAYYYRFTVEGNQQKMGAIGKDDENEHEEFMKRVMEFGVNFEWGNFSIPIVGRVGYQCSNYWRLLIKNGWVIDPNYVLKQETKTKINIKYHSGHFCGKCKHRTTQDFKRYAFTVLKDPSSVFAVGGRHPKGNNLPKTWEEYVRKRNAEIRHTADVDTDDEVDNEEKDDENDDENVVKEECENKKKKKKKRSKRKRKKRKKKSKKKKKHSDCERRNGKVSKEDEIEKESKIGEKRNLNEISEAVEDGDCNVIGIENGETKKRRLNKNGSKNGSDIRIRKKSRK